MLALKTFFGLGLFFCVAQASMAENTSMESLRLKGPLSEAQPGAFATEERVSPIPLRIERDCPPPDRLDFSQITAWNTLEFGVGIPLGSSDKKWSFYSRYTCPQPHAR